MSETFCLGKGMKAVRKPARKVSGRDDDLACSGSWPVQAGLPGEEQWLREQEGRVGDEVREATGQKVQVISYSRGLAFTLRWKNGRFQAEE